MGIGGRGRRRAAAGAGSGGGGFNYVARALMIIGSSPIKSSLLRAKMLVKDLSGDSSVSWYRLCRYRLRGTLYC